MTRTLKWHDKRQQMKDERDVLSSLLLETGERVMKTHSEMVINAFNRMMDDPIKTLDEIFRIGEQR